MSELPQIPANWKWSTMGDVAEVIGGGTPKTDQAEYFGGDISWITPADLSGYTEKFISRGSRNITKTGLENSGARLMPAGAVLFSSRAPIGYVAIAANPVSTNQGFKSFVLRGDLTPDFVYYYLQHAKKLAVELASGTTFLEISGKKAAQIPIPIAPVSEQRRIVAEIEKQFTRLEAGVAALRRVQANLKRYRAALLKAACEGRLIPTEAELHRKEKSKAAKFETGTELLARILTERRQNWQGRGKYKEPAAPDTAGLQSLPEGWTWASTEQLTLLVTSGSRGWGEFYSDIGPLFIRAQDIKTDSLKLEGVARVTLPAKAEGMRTSVENRDLLITITGANVTKSAIVRGLSEVAFVSQHVALLKPVCREASAFQFLWIVSPAHGRKFLEKRAYGAGKPGLSLEQVRSLPIALPPLAEQTRIVAEVERRLSVVEELESVVSANLQRATRLRQSILQKAFAGELVDQESEKAPSNIIELPKPEPIPRPNAHFARALLSAEIVHRLHSEPTFGRIKHQKIFHLCEHIAQIEEIHGSYRREMFGPFDNQTIYTNEGELRKQKWYRVFDDDERHAYEPLEKAGNHRKYVEKYWPDKLPIIEKLIELMRKWDTDRCEIFCTAYAAWNDLLLWGKQATEDSILHEILERWHDSKKRVPKERWLKAIAWMKKEGFVPTGFGKPTKEAK